MTKSEFLSRISAKIKHHYGVTAAEASQKQIYRAVCTVVRDLLSERNVACRGGFCDPLRKTVYYMSMEFLIGRSLRNNLFNLGLTETACDAVSELGFSLDELLDLEPDAGLGNGGLGRLAAAYLDALAAGGYQAFGYSILYEFGIFRQRIENGVQTELPDEWLEDGSVWLAPFEEDTFEVRYGGEISENWRDGTLAVEHTGYMPIYAVPYDMYISGFGSPAVSVLRLWSAKPAAPIDMTEFAKGNYTKAFEQNLLAGTISSVLYPPDNHYEGRSLRLKQQYFFVSASMQNILRNHLRTHNSPDNLPNYAAVHINDTHPALCIPELMRILMDDHGYTWEKAWDIVCRTVSYTNHTVMSEALEKWPLPLFREYLPRICRIVCEIDRRHRAVLASAFGGDENRVRAGAVIEGDEIRMANLCLCASHHVNGVSALHTEILKKDLFRDAYAMNPDKFVNVTNGITYRRWLCQANLGLSSLVTSLIGEGYLRDATELSRLLAYTGDAGVLDELRRIKFTNKKRLTDHITKTEGIILDPEAVFDVQAKRLHEYKRQLLNVLRILDLYLRIRENPSNGYLPQVCLFSAKAAPGYTSAKRIIRLIWETARMINADPAVNGLLQAAFLEDYRVTLAELIIPAAEVSEQISTAGREASGTGNMKFMINGALTLGTLDGANIEIRDAVGSDNIFIFGLDAAEAEARAANHDPAGILSGDPALRRVIDLLRSGINGESFHDIADSLTSGPHPDPYLVLADFQSYLRAHQTLEQDYRDIRSWNRKSLINIAQAGFFSADRAVREYAQNIWNIRPSRH